MEGEPKAVPEPRNVQRLRLQTVEQVEVARKRPQSWKLNLEPLTGFCHLWKGLQQLMGQQLAGARAIEKGLC